MVWKRSSLSSRLLETLSLRVLDRVGSVPPPRGTVTILQALVPGKLDPILDMPGQAVDGGLNE